MNGSTIPGGAAAGAAPAPTPVTTRAPGPNAPAALFLIFAVSLAFRLVVLPGSTAINMDPDAAHFLNVARCFERGQGFSNVGAWPAWMKPDSLPAPETFKEPGYSWLIWRLEPLTGGDPFRAGQWISMVGGLALPLMLYALARILSADRAVALLAGLLAAASPLLIMQSVRVMVDSIFPASVIAAFLLAAWRPRGRPRPLALDAAVGVALGAAFLLRGGALIMLLPLAVLAFTHRRPGPALAGMAVTVAAAAITASPFILRNLRLFGTWFHSDVGAYGIWPYVDHLTFNAGLERPPAPIAFALTHIPQVIRHWLDSAALFALHTFHERILGHQWTLPAAAGMLLALKRWREHLFAYVFLIASTTFIFAVNWDGRYFVTAAALWCVFAATGGVWMWRKLGPEPVAGRFTMRPLLLLLLALTMLAQLNVARQEVKRFYNPETPAAIAIAPELKRRLAKDEAVMVMTTSTYAWFADRPTVHLVIADRARFMATVRRLKVRMAVLPTARLAEFAARFEGGRLPEALVFERTEPALGVTVFRMVDDPAESGR
ncbi:MAG: phospholipid carrier-dependent glycosyltransferase [Candidatus Eisenbacteria bacterium]